MKRVVSAVPVGILVGVLATCVVAANGDTRPTSRATPQLPDALQALVTDAYEGRPARLEMIGETFARKASADRSSQNR